MTHPGESVSRPWQLELRLRRNGELIPSGRTFSTLERAIAAAEKLNMEGVRIWSGWAISHRNRAKPEASGRFDVA